MIKILSGFAIGATFTAAAAYLFVSQHSKALPKLNDDVSVVSEAEYNATKVPCRALVYERFGEDSRDVKATMAWRKDGYAVVEMFAMTGDGDSQFRLCVVNPARPADAVLLEEKDRPYWFEPDSEETFY